jgi:hypothetical protein
MFAQAFGRWTALLAIPAVTVYLVSLGLSDVRAQDIRDTQIDRIAREITTQISSRDGNLVRADTVAALFSEALRDRLDQPLTEQQVQDILRALRQQGFAPKPGEDLELRGVRWAHWIEHYAEGKQSTHAP